jgi:hypothetical protein
MIFSKEQLMSDDQAITGDAISTNVIDLGVRGTPYDAAAALIGDIGKGNPVPILVQVTEDFNLLTNLKIDIVCADSEDLLTAPIVLYSVTVLLAALVQGYTIPLQFLPNQCTKRYLGIDYDVTGTDPTAGKVTAGITMGNQTNEYGG